MHLKRVPNHRGAPCIGLHFYQAKRDPITVLPVHHARVFINTYQKQTCGTLLQRRRHEAGSALATLTAIMRAPFYYFIILFFEPLRERFFALGIKTAADTLISRKYFPNLPIDRNHTTFPCENRLFFYRKDFLYFRYNYRNVFGFTFVHTFIRFYENVYLNAGSD